METRDIPALFNEWVPECAMGRVRITGIARERFRRTKVAVAATDPGVDPVETCVGPSASRIRGIAKALGEPIDIVPFSDNIVMFATHAISPGVVKRALIDDDTRAIELIVTDETVDRALGDDRVNLRLASILTGWELTITSESKHEAQMQAVRNQFPRYGAQLLAAGFVTLDDVRVASPDELVEYAGIPEADGADLIARAAKAPDPVLPEPFRTEGLSFDDLGEALEDLLDSAFADEIFDRLDELDEWVDSESWERVAQAFSPLAAPPADLEEVAANGINIRALLVYLVAQQARILAAFEGPLSWDDLVFHWAGRREGELHNDMLIVVGVHLPPWRDLSRVADAWRHEAFDRAPDELHLFQSPIGEAIEGFCDQLAGLAHHNELVFPEDAFDAARALAATLR